MPRNNRLVALNRWKAVRQRDISLFAPNACVRKERAALYGFLAGDGSIKKRHIRNSCRIDVEFYPDDEYMLQKYIEFFSKVYSKTPKVRLLRNHYCAQVTNLSVGEDLLLEARFGLRTWLPPALLSREEKISWLRAFFSAEGYVGKKSVRVQTINENGMMKVSELLFELGIDHGRYSYRPKDSRNAQVYIVTILKKSAREKYLNEIGFWHSKKTAALAKSLDLKAPPEFAESTAVVA